MVKVKRKTYEELFDSDGSGRRADEFPLWLDDKALKQFKEIVLDKIVNKNNHLQHLYDALMEAKDTVKWWKEQCEKIRDEYYGKSGERINRREGETVSEDGGMVKG